MPTDIKLQMRNTRLTSIKLRKEMVQSYKDNTAMLIPLVALSTLATLLTKMDTEKQDHTKQTFFQSTVLQSQ